MHLGRKTLIGLIIVAGLGGVAYVQRIPLLMIVMPQVTEWRNPVGPNVAITWEQGPHTATTAPAERPPNIIVILLDDLGFNDLSTFGGGVAGGSVPTPHIDALAAQGISFDNGYAGNAICVPSRASLLTGRYSTRFGFEYTPLPDGMARITSGLAQQSDRLHEVHVDLDLASTMPPFADLGMPPSEITIAEVLKDRGYHTLHLGKWHLGRRAEFRPTAQGFDESLFMESGLYLPEDDPNVVNAKQDFDPIDQFLWAFMRNAVSFNDGASFQTDGYLTDYLTDQAVASIEANKHRPFFMFLAHWGVHTPLQAAKADYDALSHIADHRLRVYAAMVRSVDRSVGRVMQALRDNELDDNTLVILTSDNGGADYIGLPDINKPYRGWKLTLFEGGTHVPFFMRWPAGIPAGRHYDGVVSHIDLLPTIAAAAGADLPDDRLVDGVNLLPFATGQASGEPHKAVFWRQGYYQAVLSGGWKLQVSDKPNIDRLYHLAVDPLEQVNVAGQNPQKVTDLKALLATHNAGQSAPAWPSVIARPVSIDKTMADPEAPDDEYIYWPN